MELNDFEWIETTIKTSIQEGNTLIGILEEINDKYNYLPEPAIKFVANSLNIPLSQAYNVATFYNAFSLKPCGKHKICLCMGTACHVRGSKSILQKVERALNITSGETTPDMEFTLETVNCLGACALGPIMVIDGKYHGQMKINKVEPILKKVMA